MSKENLPHVVVIGAGFGGLTFCQKISSQNVRVTLIDRQNHHLFQPLLYQVATAGLSMPDIAEPIRSVFSDQENVRVVMEDVQAIDLKDKSVSLKKSELKYDYLVVAVGAVSNFFGNDHWEKHAIGLKSLSDAMRIRHQVLGAFERAEVEADPVVKKKLATAVIIGGGPAGVEMAGALGELVKRVFAKDFRHLDPKDARIVLVHSRDRVLNYYPDPIPEKALECLKNRDVEVILNSRVSDIGDGWVEIGDQKIEAATIVWTAGVAANPLTKTLGVDLDKSGGVLVEPDASIPGFSDAFVIGDAASLTDVNGVKVPGVSPAAMQMAKHVVKIISAELKDGPKTARPLFEYFDKGMMATIGRSAAVAAFGGAQMSGFLAWLMWLFVHLLYLVGFRSKIVVLVQWFYAYVTYNSGARIIMDAQSEEE